MKTDDIRVRGNATAEELAALLAVVTRAEQPTVEDAYARWRRIRLAALRKDHTGFGK